MKEHKKVLLSICPCNILLFVGRVARISIIIYFADFFAWLGRSLEANVKKHLFFITKYSLRFFFYKVSNNIWTAARI